MPRKHIRAVSSQQTSKIPHMPNCSFQNLWVRQLGLDLLRQLSLHHDYISSLVQDGHYLEALRYAQKHKVTSVRSSLFLEAAFASNDMQHLAVLSELIPGYKETSEYYTFYGLLDETNSWVAVIKLWLVAKSAKNYKIYS